MSDDAPALRDVLRRPPGLDGMTQHPRAARLVLVRLGQLGLHHQRGDRLPRPVPDRRGREGGRRRRRARCTRWASRSRPTRCSRTCSRSATLLQVLVLPVVGALADRTRRKRELLGRLRLPRRAGHRRARSSSPTAGTGSASVLFLVANICFGASIVVYYSLLPEIAGPDERDAVSSRGWAFGYLGGGLLLALNLVLFLNAEALGLTEGEAVRICFLSVAAWWAAFTVIPLRRLRDRPGAGGCGRPERGEQLPAAGADPARAARRTRRRCGSWPPTCCSTTASRRSSGCPPSTATASSSCPRRC